MKRYVVTLEKAERDGLAAIANKGSHRSQKVVNALILLNCDEREHNERRSAGQRSIGRASSPTSPRGKPNATASRPR